MGRAGTNPADRARALRGHAAAVRGREHPQWPPKARASPQHLESVQRPRRESAGQLSRRSGEFLHCAVRAGKRQSRQVSVRNPDGGSACLLLQTVYLPLALAGDESRVGDPRRVLTSRSARAGITLDRQWRPWLPGSGCIFALNSSAPASTGRGRRNAGPDRAGRRPPLAPLHGAWSAAHAEHPLRRMQPSGTHRRTATKTRRMALASAEVEPKLEMLQSQRMGKGPSSC